jgi:septal ring factor EnvC (AmiA/AmiB activator)
MSVLLCLLLLSPFAAAEQPLSLEAGARITELQQRLEESEKQRTLLAQQMQSQDSERESAQLSRLRQDNQRLKLAIKELQAGANPVQRLLTDQQQWF